MIPGIKKRVLNLHDVFMYVALARKHVRLMVLLLCFTMLSGLVYYIYARPVYYSKALVRMDYVPLPMDTEKLFHDSRIRTVFKELQAPHIIERTARRFGIKGSAREIRLKTILKTQIRSNSEKNLEVEVWPVAPELAPLWAKALVEEYESYRREKHLNDRMEIEESYTREVKEAAARMGQSLDEKFRIKDEQEAVKAMVELQKYSSVPAEFVRMDKRIDDMGRVKIRLEDPTLDVVSKLSLISSLAKDPQLSTTSHLGIGDEVKLSPDGKEVKDEQAAGQSVIVVPSLAPAESVWQDLEKQEQSLRNQITEKSLTYMSGHRVMVTLQKELDVIRQKLSVEYQVSKKRFDLEYQDLINRRADLANRFDEYSRAKKQSEKARQQDTIYSMSRLNWERMISDMNKKVEAMEYAWEKERVDLSFVSIIDNKDLPVSPSRGRLVVMCLGFGIILALGVPFLIEYLDHTMHSLDEVENAFQLRGLGIVPKLEYQGPQALIDREEIKETSLVENFRVIRTNLLSMGSLTKEPHVIMVTSAMPREGKTVVSSNLAISFAHNGAKTLLIDTDLRRGRMHRLFGYRKSPGLSNVLLGEVQLDDACRPTNHENLFILSAGKHIDTGTELLGSSKFNEIMGALRQKFDRIIVDTPPVLGLSETSILQKCVDGVMFVIWSGHTPIRAMKSALEILQGNGANFYGFILNRLDLNATQNYYQYYYYSHDYYYNYSPHSIEQA